jgi:hypothetical protein
MNEFNNRIDAQRQILGVVNSVRWRGEALLGLSGKALDRWLSRNALDSGGPLPSLLRTAAAELFFLANRSQEQITQEYQERSRSLHILISQIAVEVAAFGEAEPETHTA